MKPRQKKSRTYYYFWGIATLSVVLGQWYVGNGFRRMAESNDAISADINLLVESIILVPDQPQSFYDAPDAQFLKHDPLEREILPFRSSGEGSNYKVFTGILFEGGSPQP
tara:strand:- start:733 stop:1062 length:330 start_codon:yes stop_codon:yes gene_type:complete